MKRIPYIFMISGIALTAIAGNGVTPESNGATTVVDGVAVDDLKLEHDGSRMSLDMLIDMKSLKVSRNRAVLFTPRLKNGTDSVDFHSVGVYGRNRYYYYVRNGESMLTGNDETTYRASKKPDTVAYHSLIPYADWMNGAQLEFRRRDFGCCNTLLAEQLGIIGTHEEPITSIFFPELVFVQPAADSVKSRALEGSAYIDFRVDKTNIDPGYRRNPAELARIEGTIDSVRNDKDVTITQIWLKGFASPESPYAHNTELAIGRTEALKKHVQTLCKIDDSIIATDYEPEDWAGLRKYVASSNLDHRDEILAIIDSDMKPDPKEMKIKRTYPAEYKFLLDYCYPALRHTDYRIAYDVRSYSNPVEIAEVMAKSPQNLSLNEFYLLAQQYEPGSDKFNDVFETAVRMYPNDTTANLNAANAAIRVDNLEAAKRYLEKAGDSPEAIYARGALAIRSNDLATARAYLKKARDLGLPQAAATLEAIGEEEKGMKKK